MPTQLEKIEAHSSHLLDAFIRLRERYALLEPMLFDENTILLRGSRKHALGFKILRHSLFLSCAQDIAKICSDSYSNTPSISKIVASLQLPAIKQELEDRYSAWVTPLIADETDPDIAEALRRLEEHERIERRAQFLEHLLELENRWATLSNSQVMDGFLTVRDKVSAHTEIRYVADKYQPIDISALGIKWRDLRTTIDEMQRLVELIGFVVRNAGFAWDALEERLSRASSDFWGPECK